MQPPTTFAQMTKKRLVSIGNPGPTIVDHQPGLPVTGCRPAAYWSPVKAWQSKNAFDFWAFSLPNVFHAIVNGPTCSPESSLSGRPGGNVNDSPASSPAVAVEADNG
jgi:hypothetical protein